MASFHNQESAALSCEDLQTVAERAQALLEEGLDLAAEHRFGRAVQKALRAADLFEVANDKLRRARALAYASQFCVGARHYRAAAYYLWKGLRSVGKDEYALRSYFWGTLARTYRELWALNRAEKYYRLYLKSSMEEKNAEQVGYAFLGLGLNYYYLGDYQKSLEYSEKALRISESLEGKPEFQFSAKLNVACGYNGLGQHAKALSMLEPLLAEDNSDCSYLAMCRAYHELAKTYLYLRDSGRYKEARLKAGEYAILSRDFAELGRMSMLDAEAYRAHRQNRKAVQTLRKALVVFRNHGTLKELRRAENLLMSWMKGGDDG